MPGRFEEWMEEERMEGKREGIKEGIAEGIQESIVLHIEAAMESFHLSLEEACMGLRTTVEEYQRAKKSIHKLHQ